MWSVTRLLSLVALDTVSGWLGAIIITALALDVLIVHSERLLDLGTQSIVVRDEIDKLRVIHLQKHTGDLACKLGLLLVDLGVQSLTKHLLLLLWWCSIEDIHIDTWSSWAGLE